MGHEERFPPTRLSAGCGFRKETIAGMRRNGSLAPIPAVRRGGGRVERFNPYTRDEFSNRRVRARRRRDAMTGTAACC
jgi:hypothetical protein